MESVAPVPGKRQGLISVIAARDAPDPKLSRGERTKLWLHAFFADHGFFRTFYNTGSRITPEAWRSSQPFPYQLAAAKRRGVRTVINLRGPSDSGSFRLEAEACRRLGLTLVNFVIASRDVPSRETLREAKHLFEAVEYPVLMHCKAGSDRAGLMAALYLIFRKGMDVSAAKRQLSLRFGHVRQSKTGMLDHILDTYDAHNAKTPLAFTDWVEGHFDADAIKHSFMDRWWARILVDRILRRE